MLDNSENHGITPRGAKPPRGNLWFLLGSPLLGLANNIFIQKHGDSIPDGVVYFIYIIAALFLLIGLVRIERFVKAGGRMRQLIVDHKLSFGFVSLLLVVFLGNIAVSHLTGLDHKARGSTQPQTAPTSATDQNASATPSPDSAATAALPRVSRGDQIKYAHKLEDDYRKRHPYASLEELKAAVNAGLEKAGMTIRYNLEKVTPDKYVQAPVPPLTDAEVVKRRALLDKMSQDFQKSHRGATTDELIAGINQELERGHYTFRLDVPSKPQCVPLPYGVKIYSNNSHIENVHSDGCFDTGVFIQGDHDDIKGISASSTPSTTPSTTASSPGPI